MERIFLVKLKHSVNFWAERKYKLKLRNSIKMMTMKVLLLKSVKCTYTQDNTKGKLITKTTFS